MKDRILNHDQTLGQLKAMVHTKFKQ